jgi:hypothetical protein
MLRAPMRADASLKLSAAKSLSSTALEGDAEALFCVDDVHKGSRKNSTIKFTTGNIFQWS